MSTERVTSMAVRRMGALLALGVVASSLCAGCSKPQLEPTPAAAKAEADKRVQERQRPNGPAPSGRTP